MTPGSAMTSPVERIPLQDAIHPGEVEHDAAAVEGGIVVAAACAAGGDGQAESASLQEGLGNLLRPSGLKDIRREAQ